MDGFHVESVAEDEGNPLPRTRVGEPVPGEHALSGDDEILAIRGDELEERLWVSTEVLVDSDGSGMVEDTDVERPRVEIDAAVELMLLGVESY
jgi:hypothetical protein